MRIIEPKRQTSPSGPQINLTILMCSVTNSLMSISNSKLKRRRWSIRFASVTLKNGKIMTISRLQDYPKSIGGPNHLAEKGGNHRLIVLLKNENNLFLLSPNIIYRFLAQLLLLRLSFRHPFCLQFCQQICLPFFAILCFFCSTASPHNFAEFAFLLPFFRSNEQFMSFQTLFPILFGQSERITFLNIWKLIIDLFKKFITRAR